MKPDIKVSQEELVSKSIYKPNEKGENNNNSNVCYLDDSSQYVYNIFGYEYNKKHLPNDYKFINLK